MSVFSLPSTSLASPAASLLGLDSNPVDSKTSDAPSFAQTMASALGQTNALQNHAADMAQAFAQGKTSDIHSVMIAGEQATLALQLTTQIRNKAVDAYQEIMRISL